MSVYFEKLAKIRIPGDNFTWWADYKWNKEHQLWFHEGSNSGFLSKHQLPHEMTEHEMLLIAMKYS